jgi:hypothetical protein
MTEAEKILKRITRARADLAKLQTNCPHPKEHVTKITGANTGNIYEPNVYWTTFTCGVCHKIWTDYVRDKFPS